MERLLLRPGEAAEVMGVSRSKVYQLIAEGRLPGVRIDDSVRIPVDALKRWIDERVAAPSK
jgi:excisionase family DNA binding protein